jgi:hypothetical protein
MRETYVPGGTVVTFLVSSFQLPPSFQVIQRRPSSVPAKRIPGRIRRLVQRDDVREGLGAGRVGGDAARRLRGDADFHRIRIGEIGRDRVHLVTHLRRLQHAIRAEVQHLRIVSGDEEGRVPVPAQVEIGRIALLRGNESVDALLLVS